MTGPRKAALLAAIGLGLAAATLAAYAPALRGEFIDAYDDADYVFDNPRVKAGPTWAGVGWAFARSHAANWHPLTWISHMIDCGIWGLDSRGHHLSSLLLHALNSVLLLLALDRMTGRTWRAALVAALFALHPLHVESVAWISERKDLLSTLFWLLAILAWVRYARRPGAGRYATVVVLHLLALLSKPMPVTLPFTLLLLDFWPLGRLSLDSPTLRRDASRLVAEKLPLLALSAASSAVTYLVQSAAGAVTFLESLPFPARVANAVVSYAKYLVLAAWPRELAPFYPYPEGGIPPWEVAASALFLAAVTVAVLLAARTKPWLAFGWLWYVGTLVPVIGIVQVGLQSMADRYTYVPLVGIFVAVVWGAGDLARRWRVPPAFRSAAVLVLLLSLAVAARREAGTWHDSVTLFSRSSISARIASLLTGRRLANVSTIRSAV